ncbi:MAG: prepilin peptidase [Candidatus Hydrogenedentota bacterium]
MEIPAELDMFFMVLAFVIGAMAGSFSNVCICRWPEGESVVSPRSRCPRCRNPLAWYDNIPIVSWLVLGARCRHCGAPISWQYPVVEAFTGILYLLVYWRFGPVAATPVYWALCSGLVIVSFVDLREWIIPNEVTYSGVPLGLVVALVGMVWPEASGLRVVSVFDALIGVALGAGLLYILDLGTQLILKKPGMGMGDMKLLAMLGAFLGWQGVLGTLMIACVIGSAVGLGLMAIQRLRTTPPLPQKAAPPEAATAPPTATASAPDEQEAGDPTDASASDEDDLTAAGNYLPFGPYLALAGIIHLFVGPEAIEAYMNALTPAGGGPPLGM